MASADKDSKGATEVRGIPLGWANEVGWCGHVNKRPLVKPNNPFGTHTLPNLKSDTFGFITSDLNDVCIIDIDETSVSMIPDLPEDIIALIATTYTETSMSGNGLHVVFRLIGKGSVASRRAYIKAPAGTFKGQVALRNNFMVTTGNRLPTSPDDLAVLTELPDTFRLQLTHIDEQKAEQKAATNPENTADVEQSFSNMSRAPQVSEIRAALKLAKLDQSPMTRKAYEDLTGQQYEHYSYWLLIGMALRSWGTETRQVTVAYSMFLEWSKHDKAYKSEEDVLAKWTSFNDNINDVQDNHVTWKSLMALAAFLAFDYPRKEYKSGKLLSTPQTNEYCNFEYMLGRHNIRLHSADGMGYYLTGDEHILDQYFNTPGSSRLLGYRGPFNVQGLQASTLKLCQDSNWRRLSTTNTLTNVWLQQAHDNLDVFATWLDTPEEELDDSLAFTPTFKGQRHISEFTTNSTFDYVADCIKWNTNNQREDLSRAMLYKTFMQLIKFRVQLDLPFDDNGGMMAFIGPENTRKTTFFKMMLPKPLAFMRKEINMQIASDKGLRDFIRYLGRRAIVQVDEFEGFMNHKKLGPIFKAIISGNDMSITDIYQTDETIMKRKAIIVGTSNEARHVLSSNGSRRMWIAEVKSIDTTRLLAVNWHAFYRKMREEFNEQMDKNVLPWLMDNDQTKETSKRNSALATVGEVDILLAELFPYTKEFVLEDMYKVINSVQNDASGHLLTTTDVAAKLRFKGYVVKLPNLERALERFCMKYINSNEVSISLERPRCLILHGRVHQGLRKDGTYNYRKWIMPPTVENE